MTDDQHGDDYWGWQDDDLEIDLPPEPDSAPAK